MKRNVKLSPFAPRFVMPLMCLSLFALLVLLIQPIGLEIFIIVIPGAIVLHLFFGGWTHSKTKRIIETGDEVVGEVTEIIRGNKNYRLRVKFDLSGIRREQTTNNLTEIYYPKFKVGDKVKIFVERANPSNFVVLEAIPYKVVSASQSLLRR